MYLNYWTTQFYRGYSICSMTCGDEKSYVAMQGSQTWWEADTPGEVRALIDAAMDSD